MINKHFSLQFMEQEDHLVLPTVTSIVLVQNLYDVLFQYVLSPEQEEKLQAFINKLDAHIKKKSQTPFSMPKTDLAFLGEGLEELRLLNWMELPVCKFTILPDREQEWSGEAGEAALEEIIENLEDYAMISRVENSAVIYVYPYRITPI